MAATNNKLALAASGSLTATGWNTLASSTTLVAGYALAEVDNTTNLYLNYEVTCVLPAGTTPTVGTVQEVWIIPKLEDGSYADVFTGSAASATVTSREVLYGCAFRLGRPVDVASTTSNRVYYVKDSIVRCCGYMPAKFQLWYVHNMVAAAKSTGQAVYTKGIYSTSGG